MTERTDHAAEALNYLGAATDRKVAIAHVHATLALAEQQRIANLIAVSQMESGPYKDANNWTVEVRDPDGRYLADDDANAVIRDRIREALGLT